MTRAFLVVLLALATTTAYAKPATVTGCTNNQQSVSLTIDINEDLAPPQHPVLAHIQAAFANAAKDHSSGDLATEIGFRAFLSNLDQQDYDAINSIAAPPVVTGTCK